MPRACLTALTALTVAALLLAGCASEPPTAPPSVAPTESEAPAEPVGYEGPSLFVGDELSWLVPDAAALDGVLPGSGSYAGAADRLDVISDGGGPEPVPAICGVLMYESQMHATEARIVSWGDDGSSQSTGGLVAMQYPGVEPVQDLMDPLLAAAQECATIDWDGPASFTNIATLDEDGIEVLVGQFAFGIGDAAAYDAYLGYVAIGNALVTLRAQTDEAVDTAEIASLLRDTAREADERLRAALTEQLPTEANAPEGSADTAWSSWTITSEGIGPIRIGDSLETVRAAFPDLQEGQSDGEWRIPGADGAVLVVRAEDGSTVSELMVGAESLWGDDVPVDGGPLPTAGGVGIGDPLSAAIDAFPGGTRIAMIAPGQRHYQVGSRDSGTLVFALDPSGQGQDDSTIVGVLVRGAEHRPVPVF